MDAAAAASASHARAYGANIPISHKVPASVSNVLVASGFCINQIRVARPTSSQTAYGILLSILRVRPNFKAYHASPVNRIHIAILNSLSLLHRSSMPDALLQIVKPTWTAADQCSFPVKATIIKSLLAMVFVLSTCTSTSGIPSDEHHPILSHELDDFAHYGELKQLPQCLARGQLLVRSRLECHHCCRQQLVRCQIWVDR